MKRTGGRTFLMVLLLLGTWTGISLAAAYTNGDIFLSLRNGTVREYTPTGTFVQTLNTGTSGELTGSAFDAGGNFYVTAGFSGGGIWKFDTTGTKVGATPFFTNPTTSTMESILFNSAGQALSGAADGDTKIKLFDTATGGNPIQTWTVATQRRGTDWIDLAADQKTLYYTSEGTSIFKYDLSTNTQLANFTNNGDAGRQLYAFRLLGDGTIIAADTTRVLHFDSSGTVMGSYLIGSSLLFGLNIDPTGTSFWTAEYSSGDVYNVDIATGTILHHFDINTGISGVSLKGEITVSHPPTVPEPGTMMLLGSGLVGLAAWRRKK